MKILISLFLALFSIISFSQNDNENLKLATACKEVNNLDSTKFHYVIREKGSKVFYVLRDIDIQNCYEIYAVPMVTLAEKDKSLKNLPIIQEGNYAYWDKKLAKWIIKSGGFQDIINTNKNENLKLAAACKEVNNLDSTKFHYVIRERGAKIFFVLREIDVQNCNEVHAVPLITLAEKDKSLKNLPIIQEGYYAFWDNAINNWITKKGSLSDIIDSNSNEIDNAKCKDMHFGKYKYLDNPDTTSYVIREGNSHIEYYENDKYFGKFEIEWLTDCAYELTFIESNDPNVTFLSKGDKMNVTIYNVTVNGYEYIAKLNGRTIRGKYLKIY
ncbi:MAG: hypothetical protein GXO80_08760 [Chlorobi bacterium]|nr:hypothetical protein [Chlorobiota bacterium]